MNLSNLTNTLKNKFKAFVYKDSIPQTLFSYETDTVSSLPKKDIEVIHKTPLTKNNFNLIFKSISEESDGDMWSCWALGLLNVAYPAFIYIQNASNKPITMGLFLHFLSLDQLIECMWSVRGKSTFGAYAKPIVDLRGFMFDFPGFDAVIESREATPVVSVQLGCLVLQIESKIVRLSKDALWVDK